MITRITPNIINQLAENEIFVFGSNEEGRHKKGAALFAFEKCRAILGQARGLQGQSYAIVTKKNWRIKRSSTLLDIHSEILDFMIYAHIRDDLTFLVTILGCENAGYTVKDIAPMFVEATNIKNIKLPVEFWDIINEINSIEN